MPQAGTTLYFGYGSNLWLEQMALRCPTSSYLGIGRLDGYRWMINVRGYANVVQTDGAADVAYGLVYALPPADERRLDVNEGVPWAYTKEELGIAFWPSEERVRQGWVDVGAPPQERSALVYVDRRRTVDGAPKREYVVRMNKGIGDAERLGVPGEYVRGVMRRFIPEGEDEEAEELARRQALRFEDQT